MSKKEVEFKVQISIFYIFIGENYSQVKNGILHIESVSELFKAFGAEQPTHPLISIVDASKWKMDKEWTGVKLTLGLYYISLKNASCNIEYGRNTYHSGDGLLYFNAPKQLITIKNELKENTLSGWILFFHPDLLRNKPVERIIDRYRFFSYDVHEALFLTETEQKSINGLKSIIKKEISGRIDNHSQTIICSSLALLLKMSQRFYERHFNTPSEENADIAHQFHSLIKDYYFEGNFSNKGIPSVEYFSERMNLSSHYLSDLLKKTTGFSVKNHINNFILDKAKSLLLSENETVNQVAINLGFNYPHYFVRFFKSKTGLTPNRYRQLN